MNERERLALLHRWLRYAREDLLAAEAMLGQQNFWPRHACWLAQQAAAKSLKACSSICKLIFPDDMTLMSSGI
jgi:HEPN domain-containing protein